MDRKQRSQYPSPPHLAERILESCMADDVRETVSADLREEYVRYILPSRSRWRADVWYWRQVIASLPSEAVRRHRVGSTYSRTVRRSGWMAGWWRDLHYGIRSLYQRPGFTLAAASTLALGIGATTAVFAVISSVLLRPLPFDDPDQLVAVWERREHQGRSHVAASYPDFLDWRDQKEVFEHMVAFGHVRTDAVGSMDPVRLDGVAVSQQFFQLLRIRPSLGRDFAETDVTEGRRVVILSYDLWTGLFASDEAVVGTTISLNGETHTVIGVMASGVAFPSYADLWMLLEHDPRSRRPRGSHRLEVIGRLRAGTTLATARSNLEDLALRLEEAYPESNSGHGVALFSLQDELVGDRRASLTMLMGAVSLVLLIACANVANLQLARATGRNREIALRKAIGASRWRLVQQLLTESAILAGIGAALGLGLAAVGLEALTAAGFWADATFGSIELNMTVVLFAVGMSAATVMLFGLIPALQTSRTAADSALHTRGIGGDGGGGANTRLRNTLVIAEVAITIVLLAGSGVMIRSVRWLQSVHPGFDAENVLTTNVSLSAPRYNDLGRRADFLSETIRRVTSVSGVEEAGWIPLLPLNGGRSSSNFVIEGRPVPDQPDDLNANTHAVSIGYLDAMRIPLLRGRTFTGSDVASAPGVILINETMARQFWPDDDPLGRRIRNGGPDSAWITVVGVLGDVRHSSLVEPPRPELYRHILQSPPRDAHLVVRTTNRPMSYLATIRDAVAGSDPLLPMANARTMTDVVTRSIGRSRRSMMLLTIFAGVALFIAALGIFGVTAYLVSRRTQEFGIHMALGATAQRVHSMVMRDGMRLVGMGLAAGLVGTTIMSRTLSGLVYGVSPMDFITIVTVTALVFAVAMLANYIPARRAMRADPMLALRSE